MAPCNLIPVPKIQQPSTFVNPKPQTMTDDAFTNPTDEYVRNRDEAKSRTWGAPPLDPTSAEARLRDLEHRTQILEATVVKISAKVRKIKKGGS